MKKLLLAGLLLAASAFAWPHRGPIVVIRPGVVYHSYYDPFWYGYGPYYTPYYVPGPPPNACKKETLKDSEGKKHDVLACKQSDGSYKVVSADDLKKK